MIKGGWEILLGISREAIWWGMGHEVLFISHEIKQARQSLIQMSFQKHHLSFQQEINSLVFWLYPFLFFATLPRLLHLTTPVPPPSPHPLLTCCKELVGDWALNQCGLIKQVATAAPMYCEYGISRLVAEI